MVREYKSKNVLKTAGFSRQITLNFSFFNTMIPYSSLIDEFQFKIFGLYVPHKVGLQIEKMQINEPECLHQPLSPKTEPRLLRPEELQRKWLHELFT
jgi:hypothetical protein